MSGRNYPSLTTLLTAGRLPSELDLLGGAADQLLEKLRYRNLQIECSPHNDAKTFSLTLVTRELAIDLFGSGLRLIFFPPDPLNPTAQSEIDVAFGYRWAVLRYVRAFESLSFSNSARAFLDIFLSIVDLPETEFLNGIIASFITGATPEQALVDALKTWDPGDGSTPFANLDLAATPIGYSVLEYIVSEADAADVDIYVAAFETFVEDLADLEAGIDNVVTLFRYWFVGVTRDQIEDLLLPKFAVELRQVSMAIEAPRSVLVPLDDDGLEIDDEDVCSRLTFTAGGVRYDSQSGFEINLDATISADLTPSVIPGFGLTIDFSDIQVDLSRTANIAAATAEGRGPDFMGVHVGAAIIGLPPQWFNHHQPSNGPPSTLGIVGRDLLIGTGGFSGTVGLEVLLTPGQPKPAPDKALGPASLEFVLGPKPANPADARKGFKLGFTSFDMKFRQNVLLESRIKGSLTVPRFDPNPIGIDVYFGKDGDFEVTASIPAGHLFKLGTIFSYRAREVKVGKGDGKVYLRTSGELSFAQNPILGQFLKDPIKLDKLLIHSDGGIELEGGTVPLPKSAVLAIGPAKIAITAVHFGSHEQEHGGILRKYNFWGFDGGLSVNPGGVDARGDGIKLYYTVDNDPAAGRSPHSFLRINGIGVNLVIPGGASRDQAVLILKGYLALRDPVYQGSIQFSLPKVKLEGGAAMKWDTSRPAWIVDVNLSLPRPFPLAQTGLGIYAFRGLFGLRYLARKQAVGLTEEDSWGDYYRAPPRKGVTIDKFDTPDDVPDVTDGADNPFSIGVGVGLATMTGNAFSAQLFLLISLPELILLEGRAAILAKRRVGMDDDPPYYAYLALSPSSIELGVGVNYLIAEGKGDVLNLNATLEAAFFFHNTSAWYVNFGTKAEPATARVINMFDAYAYLMLSASGIEAGTGVHYDFDKNYGPVHVGAHAYLDMWAYLSFERKQAGGGIALGGWVEATVYKVGFNISLDAILTVEMPKPFRIAGSVEVCVSVDLKFYTFSKCCDLDFVWARDQTVDLTVVDVMTLPQSAVDAPPATAVHMLSGATYPVAFSAQATVASPPLIPLDAYVDVKFTKPVNPAAVAGIIGGFTSPPVDVRESLPPRYGSRVVVHEYALTDIKLESSDGAGGWIDYHPYQALTPDAVLPSVQDQLATMPLGVWQKQGLEYSQIRFLALTSFSWMGPAVGYKPEEMGVTAKSTWCVGRAIEERCLTWADGQIVFPGADFHSNGVLWRVDGPGVAVLPMAEPRLAPVSIAVPPHGLATFRFTEPAAQCRLTLLTNAPSVVVRWQRRKPPGASATGVEIVFPWEPPEYEDAVAPVVVPRAGLASPVVYNDPDNPIERVLVQALEPDAALIADLQTKIILRQEDWIRASEEQRPMIGSEIAGLEERLRLEHARTCVGQPAPPGPSRDDQIADLQAELDLVRKTLEEQQAKWNAGCVPPPPPPPPPPDETVGECVKRRLDAVGAAVRRLVGKTILPEAECGRLAAEIASLKQIVADLEKRIAELRKLPPDNPESGGAPIDAPAGFACATFIHELCWLSRKDWAYNGSIPGIDAIAADFSAMRDAIQGTIQPIWRPNETYRITLQVTDTVTDPDQVVAAPATQTYYVHFRTGGPIGHFTGIPTPEVFESANPSDLTRAQDDDRPLAPERALQFYIDKAKSYPDPTGALLSAKRIYWRAVVLRLFFDKAWAYHFFADWPAGVGDHRYSLEIQVKDPAETTALADAEPHEVSRVVTPKLGALKWVADGDPPIAPEIATFQGFQNPLAEGETNATACLSIGGDPVLPLSRWLEVSMGDLEPDKLYTAVVLNRSLDDTTVVAEVASFPFRTSRFADLDAHVASLRCKDKADPPNQALAVFAIDHPLAAPGAEAQALADVLATVKRTATSDTEAYPDSFDRLIHGLLKLPPPDPAATLEFNFLTNAATGKTWGLWIRSPLGEALDDPRRPQAVLDGSIRLFETGAPRSDAIAIMSRDACQAFVMIDGPGDLPLADVSVEFSHHWWDGDDWVATVSVSEPFGKP